MIPELCEEGENEGMIDGWMHGRCRRRKETIKRG